MLLVSKKAALRGFPNTTTGLGFHFKKFPMAMTVYEPDLRRGYT